MYMMMYDYAHNLKVEDRGDSSSFAYLWTHQFSPSGLSSNQNCSKPFQHLVKLEIVEYDWIILVTVAPCSQHVVGWQQMRFETTFVRLQLGMEAMDTWTSSHAPGGNWKADLVVHRSIDSPWFCHCLSIFLGELKFHITRREGKWWHLRVGS